MTLALFAGLRSLRARALCGLVAVVAATASCGAREVRQQDCGVEARSECCGVWQQHTTDGCQLLRWELPPQTPAIGENGYDSQIAIAASGTAHIAFATTFEHGGSALVVADEATGWGLYSPSKQLVGHAIKPQLAVGADGYVALAWHQSLQQNGRVYFAERKHGIWKIPTVEQAVSLPDGHGPTMRLAPNGEVFVVYDQWVDPGYVTTLARRAPLANEFDTAAGAHPVLSQAVHFTNGPRIAVNSHGDVLVTWYQAVDQGLLVWPSERSGYSGQFSRPMQDDVLSPTATSAREPYPTMAADGSAAVVWGQELALLGPGMVVMLATRSATGSWTRATSLDDRFSKPADRVRAPQALFAPSGDLYVVWEQHNGSDSGIYVAHRSPSGSWLASGTEPLRLSAATALASDPVLALGKHGVAVVYNERWQGRASVMVRLSSTQSTDTREAQRWLPATRLSAGLPGDARGAAVAIGGSPERAVVCWSQSESVRYAVLQQPVGPTPVP